jgi:hypothetical protein
MRWKVNLAIGCAAMTALFGGIGTAVASAEIVVGKGADGIDLGETKSAVISSHGKPFSTRGKSLVFGPPCLCTVTLGGSVVRSIDVLSKTQKTDKGIGAGSTYAATTAAYPEARCFHPNLFGDQSRQCVLRTVDDGRKVKTIFSFFEKTLPLRDVEISGG